MSLVPWYTQLRLAFVAFDAYRQHSCSPYSFVVSSCGATYFDLLAALWVCRPSAWVVGGYRFKSLAMG